MKDVRHKLIVLSVEYTPEGFVFTAKMPQELLDNLKSGVDYRLSLDVTDGVPSLPDPRITPTTSKGNYPRKTIHD